MRTYAVILTILLILSLFGLASCNNRQPDYPKWDIPMKPFYVVNKYHIAEKQKAPAESMCGFWYLDKNGKQFVMHSACDQFNVGDTIK